MLKMSQKPIVDGSEDINNFDPPAANAQPTKFKLEVSVSCQNPESAAARWLRANQRLLRNLGTILAIVQPEQFDVGMRILKKLREDEMLVWQPEVLEPVLQAWGCPFSGISILCNSKMPMHHNRHGQDNWYDLLGASGTYTKHYLDLPGIGAQVAYSPGTVVAIAGRIVAHGTEFVEDGDQAVFACFTRRNVREWMRLPEGDYATIESVTM